MPKRLRTLDAVIIGAGVVGAACAYYAGRAGLAVAVVDRGPVAGGTTGAGEGNLLVSDKEPGPELDLALLSVRLWRELAAALPQDMEYETKGGLVVAPDAATLRALRAYAEGQRAAGVEAAEVPGDTLRTLEPHLADGLAGGFLYPQDAQIQPARAAARLLAASGAAVHLGEEVTAILRTPSGAVRGVRTDRRELAAPAVVNAAGTWGGAVAALAGTDLPVLPRRGFVLVTEPLPRVVRHKVYAADYIADVASGSAALQSSAVVEGTPAGPVLIGATRERVGFDRSLSVEALRRLASQAAALFPVLADVRVLRAYHGFRPYLPDHLPAIGPDPRVPGLHHACGHEGAGIGLAPATGLLVAAALTGETPPLNGFPFRPERFTAEAAVPAAPAAVAVPDAGTAVPDAAVIVPDASTAVPDAGTVVPDAATVVPDPYSGPVPELGSGPGLGSSSGLGSGSGPGSGPGPGPGLGLGPCVVADSTPGAHPDPGPGSAPDPTPTPTPTPRETAP